MTHESPLAVLLLSGGIDSSTCGAIARRDGFRLAALSFRYGQRHAAELAAAARMARQLEVTEHRILDIDLRAFGGSSLTTDMPVPRNRSDSVIGAVIPSTYVPARNTIFLSCALGLAEVLGSRDIFIGVNAVDYSGYPDCRPEYIEAYQRMANLATRAAVDGQTLTIHTPLIRLTKGEIIRTGALLGLDLSMTHSCYDPSPEGLACGGCDSCVLRRKGFIEAGIPDVTKYAC